MWGSPGKSIWGTHPSRLWAHGKPTWQSLQVPASNQRGLINPCVSPPSVFAIMKHFLVLITPYALWHQIPEHSAPWWLACFGQGPGWTDWSVCLIISHAFSTFSLLALFFVLNAFKLWAIWSGTGSVTVEEGWEWNRISCYVCVGRRFWEWKDVDCFALGLRGRMAWICGCPCSPRWCHASERALLIFSVCLLAQVFNCFLPFPYLLYHYLCWVAQTFSPAVLTESLWR